MLDIFHFLRMEIFNFISTYISQLFNNSGLHQYFVFMVACFGVVILYNIVGGWVNKSWHY